MKTNYILYNPADFGAVEIKEDTRDAEILRLRAENAKLRAALMEIAENYDNLTTSRAGLAAAAAAALKETHND